MATASTLLLCLGFRRDTAQRNRHSQTEATVTASQTRLRSVSIGSAVAIRGEADAVGLGRRGKSSRNRDSLQRGQSGSKLSQLRDLHRGACMANAPVIAFAR
jgi:hypothetical protein